MAPDPIPARPRNDPEIDPLDALRARGILSEPKPRLSIDDLPTPIKAKGSVSDLVSELRDGHPEFGS